MRTQDIDGDTVWFNDRGEQVAHYPDMLLHSLLCRTLEQAEATGRVSDAQAVLLEHEMQAAWPLQADDSAAQFTARQRLVELFRLAGLVP